MVKNIDGGSYDKIDKDMESKVIGKEDLIRLANSWFAQFGINENQRFTLKQSRDAKDIVASRRIDILQTFLNHFLLQQDFDQNAYNMNPEKYVRERSMLLLNNLNTQIMITDHMPKLNAQSWDASSNLDQIAAYLGVGVHTKGETPIMKIESALHESIPRSKRSFLTGFLTS